MWHKARSGRYPVRIRRAKNGLLNLLRIVTWSCNYLQIIIFVSFAQSAAEGQDPLNKCPGYDTKQFDGEAPVMLELWGISSTPSLPLLPGPLWPRVVAPDKGPIYGLNRTKLWFTVFSFKLCIYAKLNCLK